jgi:hypothetical protein
MCAFFATNPLRCTKIIHQMLERHRVPENLTAGKRRTRLFKTTRSRENDWGILKSLDAWKRSMTWQKKQCTIGAANFFLIEVGIAPRMKRKVKEEKTEENNEEREAAFQ